MNFFAYIHYKPDGTPFYVGKGVRTRYKNFAQRNQYHKRIVAKYGQENILIGKIDCSTNNAALELEIGLIKCLRNMGIELANLTDGGEGTVGWTCPDSVKQAVAEANSKRVFSKETRYKLGASYRGKKRPEHSALLAQRGTWAGKNNPFFGTGNRQVGAENLMARTVKGTHPEHGQKIWYTATDAAKDIGVTLQAVVQAVKRKHRSKGWALEYLE